MTTIPDPETAPVADLLQAMAQSIEALRRRCSGRSICSDPQCGDSTWDHYCDLGGHDERCCHGLGYTVLEPGQAAWKVLEHWKPVHCALDYHPEPKPSGWQARLVLWANTSTGYIDTVGEGENLREAIIRAGYKALLAQPHEPAIEERERAP